MPPAPVTRRSRLKWMVAGAALLLAAAGAAGLVVVYSGAYSVSALEQHYPPVFWVLEQGMRYSVRRHAAGVEVPPLDDPALVRTGLRCFHDHCVQCHGAPGIPPEDIGKGLTPIPSSLTQTARDWPPADLYWVTKNGIRMAGMPAWEYRIADADLWAIVAFLGRLPDLTAAQYRELLRTAEGAQCSRPESARAGEADRGPVVLRQYGCHGCHRIPGVTGPDVHVGPPLDRFAARKYIAGVLPNTRENLVRWIRDPQDVSPLTTMPDLDVTEVHARDMAAYLATLE